MKVQIRKEGQGFVVDPVELPGMPAVGRGSTLDEALGSFVRSYQKELGLEITLDQEAQEAEYIRREQALAGR